MEALRHATRLKTLAGYVERLEASENNVYLDIRYCNALERHAYDVVVVSIGFDPLSLFESFGDSAREALARCLKEEFLTPQFREELALKIGHDLSVKGLEARLHLPMVSGLSQGPGFSNLSCLGILSDRILETYLEPTSRAMKQRAPKLASY